MKVNERSTFDVETTYTAHPYCIWGSFLCGTGWRRAKEATEEYCDSSGYSHKTAIEYAVFISSSYTFSNSCI